MVMEKVNEVEEAKKKHEWTVKKENDEEDGKRLGNRYGEGTGYTTRGEESSAPGHRGLILNGKDRARKLSACISTGI